MKNHVFVAVACLFLAACSDGGETKVAKLEAIPLGVAFENQTELKTSDCFKKIRYVALETTDSCLVGQGAYATILNDWIVVTSGRIDRPPRKQRFHFSSHENLIGRYTGSAILRRHPNSLQDLPPHARPNG